MSLYCSACDGMGTHSPECPLNLSPPSPEPAGETNAAPEEFDTWFAREYPTEYPEDGQYIMMKDEYRPVWEAAISSMQVPCVADVSALEKRPAPLSDLCGRLEEFASLLLEGHVKRLLLEAAAALREMEARRAAAHDAMRTAHDARLQSERRAEELLDLLVEALTFVDTNPDLHRIGGDELKARISAAIRKAAGL